MRFIITAQPAPGAPNADPAAEQPFDQALFARYMKFNEELQNAGVLVASEGLNPAHKGAHVIVSNGERVAKDGPFAETKELIGGFYLIDVDSLDEAVAWALRCPSGFGFDDVLEIRQLTGSGDIPPELLALTAEVAPNWTATFSRR
jgi:hypothetical protein